MQWIPKTESWVVVSALLQGEKGLCIGYRKVGEKATMATKIATKSLDDCLFDVGLCCMYSFQSVYITISLRKLQRKTNNGSPT